MSDNVKFDTALLESAAIAFCAKLNLDFDSNKVQLAIVDLLIALNGIVHEIAVPNDEPHMNLEEYCTFKIIESIRHSRL